MGIIGTYLTAKAIDKAFTKGNIEIQLSEEEQLLIDAKTALEELDNEEISEYTEISIVKSKKRKLKNGKHPHSLAVIKANPNGVALSNCDFDLSNFTAIAVLDDKQICIYNKNTDTMFALEINKGYSYGPHDDYFKTINALDDTMPADKSYHFTEAIVDCKKINGKNEIEKTSFPQNNANNKDNSAFLNLAAAISKEIETWIDNQLTTF